MTPTQIAAIAYHPGLPELTPSSSRDDLIAWLVACDPDGTWTDEAAALEGFPLLTLAGAWLQVLELAEARRAAAD